MRRSVLALVVSLAGLAYAACAAFALSRMGGLGLIVLRMADRALEFSPATPYLGLAALADAAIWARFISKKRGFALASALLYGAAAPFALSEPALMAGPLALALAALADFLRPAAAAADSAAAEDADLPADDLGLSDEDLSLPDDDLDEDLDDAGPEDEAEGARSDMMKDDLDPDAPGDEPWPAADGTGIFLGVFAALAAAALIGVVVFGLVTGRLPFVP